MQKFDGLSVGGGKTNGFLEMEFGERKIFLFKVNFSQGKMGVIVVGLKIDSPLVGVDGLVGLVGKLPELAEEIKTLGIGGSKSGFSG